MLFLLFQIGSERYALRASRVVEVLPLVALKHVPQAPKSVAGILNYRGRPVPVVDLSELTIGTAAKERLSTRIIIVQYPEGRGGTQLLGLIAENATEVVQKQPEQFADPGMKLRAAPYLGPVLMDPKGSVQLLQEQRLLPQGMRELLFSEKLLVS